VNICVKCCLYTCIHVYIVVPAACSVVVCLFVSPFCAVDNCKQLLYSESKLFIIFLIFLRFSSVNCMPFSCVKIV